MKSYLKDKARMVRLALLRIISLSRVLTKFYFVFSNDFDREFEFTLKGRVRALGRGYDELHSSAHLRRCIHRLEKGIYHPNRKAVFGAGVVDELYDELVNIDPGVVLDPDEVDWSISVLEIYLDLNSSVKADKCIKILRSFNTISVEENVDFSGDSYQKFLDLCLKRESVRFFKEQEVPKELINKAVYASREAPSACNRQPFSLFPLYDRGMIQKIGGLAPGTSGFLDGIPVLIPVVGRMASFRHARDRHLIYTDSGLFLGHFILALESLGLSSCVLNWTPDWKNDREAIEALNLGLDNTIVCLLAVGYRKDISVPVSTKKSVQNITRYETN